MSEMMARRNGGGFTRLSGVKMHELLGQMALPSQVERHESPTKRLIQHKDSTWDHKARVSFGLKQDLASTSKHVQQRGLMTGDYSQVYSVEPGKTYVIEPQGGELPYEMAD